MGVGFEGVESWRGNFRGVCAGPGGWWESLRFFEPGRGCGCGCGRGDEECWEGALPERMSRNLVYSLYLDAAVPDR